MICNRLKIIFPNIDNTFMTFFEDITKIQKEKLGKNGGFEKRILLLSKQNL